MNNKVKRGLAVLCSAVLCVSLLTGCHFSIGSENPLSNLFGKSSYSFELANGNTIKATMNTKAEGNNKGYTFSTDVDEDMAAFSANVKDSDGEEEEAFYGFFVGSDSFGTYANYVYYGGDTDIEYFSSAEDWDKFSIDGAEGITWTFDYGGTEATGFLLLISEDTGAMIFSTLDSDEAIDAVDNLSFEIEEGNEASAIEYPTEENIAANTPADAGDESAGNTDTDIDDDISADSGYVSEYGEDSYEIFSASGNYVTISMDNEDDQYELGVAYDSYDISTAYVYVLTSDEEEYVFDGMLITSDVFDMYEWAIRDDVDTDEHAMVEDDFSDFSVDGATGFVWTYAEGDDDLKTGFLLRFDDNSGILLGSSLDEENAKEVVSRMSFSITYSAGNTVENDADEDVEADTDNSNDIISGNSDALIEADQKIAEMIRDLPTSVDDTEDADESDTMESADFDKTDYDYDYSEAKIGGYYEGVYQNDESKMAILDVDDTTGTATLVDTNGNTISLSYDFDTFFGEDGEEYPYSATLDGTTIMFALDDNTNIVFSLAE